MLTKQRVRAYFIIGFIAVIASGWGSDYQSCTRSAFWVGYFNRLSTEATAAAQRASKFAMANSTSPTKVRLDRQTAAADRAEARALRTQPLVCLHFPLPETPSRTPY